ncbi:stomatin-like protein 3 [Scaptodrosophila lebanonensis]|uniref:Stomatin-like protein 3 n=1 Tax=Drosophila lebanonensis TaxID=7225 RepID=A0A6J2TGR1_DROLE|nr:stomatin-like protein 3 [Scaptodrosophila lebanonensis]
MLDERSIGKNWEGFGHKKHKQGDDAEDPTKSPKEEQPREEKRREDKRREEKRKEEKRKEEKRKEEKQKGRRTSKKSKKPLQQTTEKYENRGLEKFFTILSMVLAVITFPVSVFICLVVLKEFQRAVVLRLGRLRAGARGPGLTWILPCIDRYAVVDLRTRVEEVPTQDVITRDSVTIRVDAVLFYSVYNPIASLLQVDDVDVATLLLAQTTLRNAVGAQSFLKLVEFREKLSKQITEAVNEATQHWGVKVERIEIKDISLPEEMQRALASEAEAYREARAKVISAQGELNASAALKDASDVMATNIITLQLRQLQILTSIATERNCRIIYPFPMDLMTGFEGSYAKGNADDSGGSNKKSTSTEIGDNSLLMFSNKNEEELPKTVLDGKEIGFFNAEEVVSDAPKVIKKRRLNELVTPIFSLIPDREDARPSEKKKAEQKKKKFVQESVEPSRPPQPPEPEPDFKPGDFFYF